MSNNCANLLRTKVQKSAISIIVFLLLRNYYQYNWFDRETSSRQSIRSRRRKKKKKLKNNTKRLSLSTL